MEAQMPANTNLPPRPSLQAVRQARHLITNPQDFTYMQADVWEKVQKDAWRVLHDDHQHRTAPVVLHLHGHQPGDAA
ncbi:MAG: hypothetical protein A2341_14930 [Deltaproteobacteria bacterium RIFOXYB12_FULL_58_9]|nr:MAG: hypothetical protein A2341_14930 [Deltaproteobacteria bacterium RIFOXYB12_FULL_58_9]